MGIEGIDNVTSLDGFLDWFYCGFSFCVFANGFVCWLSFSTLNDPDIAYRRLFGYFGLGIVICTLYFIINLLKWNTKNNLKKSKLKNEK